MSLISIFMLLVVSFAIGEIHAGENNNWSPDAFGVIHSKPGKYTTPQADYEVRRTVFDFNGNKYFYKPSVGKHSRPRIGIGMNHSEVLGHFEITQIWFRGYSDPDGRDYMLIKVFYNIKKDGGFIEEASPTLRLGYIMVPQSGEFQHILEGHLHEVKVDSSSTQYGVKFLGNIFLLTSEGTKEVGALHEKEEHIENGVFV